MKLLKIIEEQSVIAFCGKINILKVQTGQFLGEILLYNGLIVNASYLEHSGKKALLYIIYDDFYNKKKSKYVVEPEILDEGLFRFEYTYEETFKIVDNEYQEYLRITKSKLRPPNNVRVTIKPEFISSGGEISGNEFELFSTITDYELISEIYANSTLHEFETTKALVSLRESGALSVSGA